MSYDPKASRPDTDDSDHAAPVDQLLGAGPPPGPTTESDPEGPAPETADRDDDVAAPARRPEPGPTMTTGAPPLPEPVATRRTARNVITAAVAVVIVLVGWRLRRRH